MWNRTVVLRCSELVEWHLRAQMAPLWPSGTLATYRPEWEELAKTTRNALTEPDEEKNARDEGSKKSPDGSNDIGRPSLVRTSLFASGLAACELEDVPNAKERTSHETGKSSTPRSGASQKQVVMTQRGLTDSQKKGCAVNAHKRAGSPGNGRRGKAVATNGKPASSQKRGRKKVSPRVKKTMSKTGHMSEAVVSQTESSIEHEQVNGGTCDEGAHPQSQCDPLPVKSESNCTDSHSLARELVSGASENPSSLVDSTYDKYQEPKPLNAIRGSMMKPNHEFVDIKNPEPFTGEHRSHLMDHVIGNKKAIGTQSTPGRAHCVSHRRSVDPVAPLLARARKIKLEKKRRQSREQMELESEDGGQVIAKDGIQSSGLDDHEVKEDAQEKEENGQKPQRRRGRKRKKIDTRVVNKLNSSQRRVTVRRTSMIVKRDITELFALCTSFSSALPTIVLISYSHYCRYKALQLRLAEYERLWCHPEIESMTGMKVTDGNTRLVFCRALFKNPNLLKLGVTMAMPGEIEAVLTSACKKAG